MDSLMPQSDSARMRGESQFNFKTATTGVAAKAMRNEISNLVRTVGDPTTKKGSCAIVIPRGFVKLKGG